ncbi:MAG: type II toxin-antitoxin system RelE/ParE family toxin [Gammaproteobacteria bacterium]|nr:type II toxin-antitoxin system RelE/ParE family toxin [Gammaproteobacteria bacterium]
MKQAKFEYTETFASQMDARFQRLAGSVGGRSAEATLMATLQSFEERVGAHPFSAPVCKEMVDLGRANVREYIDVARQQRLIYQVSPEGATVTGLLLLSTRQSVEEALVQYCLWRE